MLDRLYYALQRFLPTAALSVAVAVLSFTVGVILAPKTRAQAPYPMSWVYQWSRETFNVNPPLTGVTLQHLPGAPPPDWTPDPNLMPVLVFLDGKLLMRPLTPTYIGNGQYTISGRTILFPFGDPGVAAPQVQVVYEHGM